MIYLGLEFPMNVFIVRILLIYYFAAFPKYLALNSWLVTFWKIRIFFNTTALLLESAYLTLACGKIKSLNVGIAGVSQYCNYNEIIRLTCIIESAVRISWKYLSIWYQICFDLHNKYRSVGKLKNLSLNIFIWMKKISKNS